MKAILEFNLPEEKEEFKMASSAADYYSCLWNLMNLFRSNLKYTALSDTEYDIWEGIQKRFFEILEENDIILL